MAAKRKQKQVEESPIKKEEKVEEPKNSSRKVDEVQKPEQKKKERKGLFQNIFGVNKQDTKK